MSLRRNILLLSAGRRVALAQIFRNLSAENGVRLFVADACPQLSAACHEHGASFQLPHIGDPEYVSALASLCQEQMVGLVIPTIDPELSILAEHRESFWEAGTALLVCDKELISVARDKRETAKFFDGFGVVSPLIYSPAAPEFPAIAKPYDGSSSKDLHILLRPEDFTDEVKNIKNLMLAQYIDPVIHDEFTCDAYYDQFGYLRCVVPRLRIEVRGGEVAKGRTCRNNIVEMFWLKLRHIPGARGCLTFQFFRNKINGALVLIEVNARFGGGFPLTYASGANFPLWAIKEWVDGELIPDFHEWKEELTMLRYDAAIFV